MTLSDLLVARTSWTART